MTRYRLLLLTDFVQRARSIRRRPGELHAVRPQEGVARYNFTLAAAGDRKPQHMTTAAAVKGLSLFDRALEK